MAPSSSTSGVHWNMQQPQSELEPATSLKTEHPEAGKRVMIIDDDSMICAFLQDLLSGWGMQPETLRTPDDISERLPHATPDLYLLDIHMPSVNGLELLPRIVDQNPDSKVIMMPTRTKPSRHFGWGPLISRKNRLTSSYSTTRATVPWRHWNVSAA